MAKFYNEVGVEEKKPTQVVRTKPTPEFSGVLAGEVTFRRENSFLTTVHLQKKEEKRKIFWRKQIFLLTSFLAGVMISQVVRSPLGRC